MQWLYEAGFGLFQPFVLAATGTFLMATLIVQVVAVLGMGHRKAVISTAAEAALAQQQAGCRLATAEEKRCCRAGTQMHCIVPLDAGVVARMMAPAAALAKLPAHIDQCGAKPLARQRHSSAQQSDTPRTLDQAEKPSSAEAEGAASCASYQANQHSTSIRTAGAVSTVVGADGSVLIKKRLQQHSPKSSLRPAAHSPSTHSSARKSLSTPRACRTLATASGRFPAGVAQVRVVAASDLDVSSPSDSPCAGSPAGLLAPSTVGQNLDADADQPYTTSTPRCSADAPAATSSPVGALMMAGRAHGSARQGDAGCAAVQRITNGSGAPSSAQHSAAVHGQAAAAAPGSTDAAVYQRASLTGSLPGGLNAVCALLPVLAQASGSWEQLQAADSEPSRLQQPLGNAVHCSLPAINMDMQQPAAITNSPGGVHQACCIEVRRSSNTHGCTLQPAAKHSMPRHVRFAPLPPSKDIWLQQLRRMPPEGKARFLRRLQLVGRKAWCMWRQRSRHHQQQQQQRHGLKRDWQQAAAESDSSDEEEQVGSPCKRALSPGRGLSRRTASRLARNADGM